MPDKLIHFQFARTFHTRSSYSRLNRSVLHCHCGQTINQTHYHVPKANYPEPIFKMPNIDWRAKMELQYSIDYFEHYHRGRYYSGPNARRPIFREFPIPYWDPPRPDPAFAPPAKLRTDKDRTPFREYLRTDSEATGGINENVLKALKDFGLTLIRVVGSGSQGIAALFQYRDQKVVLKWGTEVECMVLEMWAMRQLVGARHIIQVSLDT